MSNHEMENSKRIKTRDRLSELPDSLIFHIFGFLPITEVVRTTILSKRWEDLWTTVPFLHLDGSAMSYFSHHTQVRDFFNRALILWGGIKILKFKIELDCQFKESLVNDVDVWVRFATDKAAEELELRLNWSEEKAYLVPRCLYSCSSLKVLSLIGCHLRIDGNVRWDQLKSLTIHLDDLLDPHAIAQVLLGCPRLEVFALAIMDIDDSLTIQSSSLKRLAIGRMPGLGYSELIIRTPNLETLELLWLTYHKCSLEYASSLTDVNLGFFDYADGVDENGLLEGTLRQILPTIRHVQSLTLSSWCIKVLKLRIDFPTFPNVKFLKIVASSSKLKKVAGLLKFFPKLERLVVHEDIYYDSEDEDDQVKFETNLSASSLLQLKTVEVAWVERDNSIFPCVEILLKYASKLEKLVFRGNAMMPQSPPSKSCFSALQKLLRMPRSSPTSQLIFREY